MNFQVAFCETKETRRSCISHLLGICSAGYCKFRQRFSAKRWYERVGCNPTSHLPVGRVSSDRQVEPLQPGRDPCNSLFSPDGAADSCSITSMVMSWLEDPQEICSSPSLPKFCIHIINTMFWKEICCQAWHSIYGSFYSYSFIFPTAISTVYRQQQKNYSCGTFLVRVGFILLQ